MPGPGRLGAGQAGANGEGQDALNFPSGPAARRPFQSPRLPGVPAAKGPLPACAPILGATHMAMPLARGVPPGNSRIPIGSGRVQPGAPRLETEGPPGPAACSRGPGRGGRAARRGSAPPVRARAAVPRASLRGARARLSTAPAGPGARCSQAAAGPCGRRAPRLSPPPPPLHTAGAGAADPGERWQLCALSRHLGELEAPAPSA